jgi:hypothetical protein
MGIERPRRTFIQGIDAAGIKPVSGRNAMSAQEEELTPRPPVHGPHAWLRDGRYCVTERH